MARIAIFGAGGFIGSHLVERLVIDGSHTVIAVDRVADKLAHLDPSGYHLHLADVRRQPDLMEDIVAQADVVVDLMAYANPSMYIEAPLEVVDVNFSANLAIVEACVAHRRRLIQYSSSEVYGKFAESEGLAAEDRDLVYGPISKHRWIYACAKQLLERIIHAHGLAGQLEFTIFRPFNFIGPRLDYLVPAGAVGGPRVFAHFMSALLSGGPLLLVDGGGTYRTFLAIEDAVDAFMAVLEQPEAARNQIYNVGNPSANTTIRGLAELMLAVYGELVGRPPTSPLQSITAEEFYGSGYEDADRLPPDISRLAQLGWQPRYSLRDTVRRTMEAYLVEHRAGLSAPAIHLPRRSMDGAAQ